jgi:hypothetical protein
MAVVDNASDRVLLDPAAAHPELGVLRSALAVGDWGAGRAVLDVAPLPGRTWLLHWAAEDRGFEDLLRYVLQVDPSDSTAAALLALTLIDSAWQARGRAHAEDVSADRFAVFRDRLRQAELVLIDAAARTPQDPAVWSARLMTARGLHLGLAEIDRRYARLTAAAPDDLAGQEQYLQSLCPKWYGTWELAHGWAWRTLQAAPPGALQGALVARAHLEHWLELSGSDRAAGQAYLSSAVVRDELYQAAHRSVWHPDLRGGPGWVPAASVFAMVFSLMGDHAAAAPTFELLGDFAGTRPWDYLGPDVAGTVRERRRLALRVAAGAR